MSIIQFALKGLDVVKGVKTSRYTLIVALNPSTNEVVTIREVNENGKTSVTMDENAAPGSMKKACKWFEREIAALTVKYPAVEALTLDLAQGAVNVGEIYKPSRANPNKKVSRVMSRPCVSAPKTRYESIKRG